MIPKTGDGEDPQRRTVATVSRASSDLNRAIVMAQDAVFFGDPFDVHRVKRMALSPR